MENLAVQVYTAEPGQDHPQAVVGESQAGLVCARSSGDAAAVPRESCSLQPSAPSQD
jgi:hypothetical protein